jgi:type IV secretory pathway VirB10-like protein
MLRRPMARRPMGRGGVVGTVARTAVVAGTATAVVGGMSRHQQAKAEQAADAQAYQQEQQDAAMQAAAQQAVAQQQAAAAPPPPPPAAAGDPTIAELERLASLKQQGILTDDEFAAAKAKVLGLG